MIPLACTTAWTAFGFSLLGILIGAIVAHYLTKDRDVAARKAILDREADIRRRHFRKHVLKYRYLLERTPHDRPDDVWTRYSETAPDFLAEAAIVDGDFVPRDQFTAIVHRAGHWRRADAESSARSAGKDLRDVLRDSICDVYDFTVRDARA
jgi:hypothetical protein